MRYPALFLVFLSSLICACGSFDDPALVYDLRVLGAIAEPPEILVPTDPEAIDPSMLPEVRVCVLVADPGDTRSISYAMVACPGNSRGRCDVEAQPQLDLGSGTAPDPDEGESFVEICETLGPNPVLGEILERSVSLDSLAGFGAIDIQVGIEVWPEGRRDEAVFATKKVRFGASIPEEREANQNPTLERTIMTRLATGEESDLPIGTCDGMDPPRVAPGEQISLLPVEPPGAREDYVVPTLDGDVRRFTELLDYRFYSTSGKFSPSRSGGERDLSGALPPLDVRWRAPTNLEEIGNGIDVVLYGVQRDERGGQSWIRSCLRVVP